MDFIFEFISHTIISLIETGGYAGIAFLMALEGSFVPVPSEIILPFSGYLVAQGKLSLLTVALVGAVGNIIGTLITYFIARYAGLPFFYRYGKYVMITSHDIDSARRLFERRGVHIIFISRLIPGIRGFVPIAAGVAKMPLVPFAIYVFVGSFLYSLLLTYVGVVLGKNWAVIDPYFRQYNWVLVLLGVVFVVWWVRRHMRKIKSTN